MCCNKVCSVWILWKYKSTKPTYRQVHRWHRWRQMRETEESTAFALTSVKQFLIKKNVEHVSIEETNNRLFSMCYELLDKGKWHCSTHLRTGTDAHWNNGNPRRGPNKMLVGWKSSKCQTAYRLLSPCNLNSQHQSDKLSYKSTVTNMPPTHMYSNNKRENPNPTYRGRREEMWMLWAGLVQSRGFNTLNSTPLFWIYSSDSSPGSVTGAVQRVHSKVQLR